jgi:protein FAM50
MNLRPKRRASTPQPPKKKRKNLTKGKLSFGLDEGDEDEFSTSATISPRGIPSNEPSSSTESPATDEKSELPRRKLMPNASVGVAPKAKTKAILLREAQTREQLRKEYLEKRELVKATDFLIPFVFYDGSNIPGGVCRVKKGDHVWFFLDKARKVGAELGVGGDKGRKEWARVSVDDLMMVRGEMIIPHVRFFPGIL